MGEGLGVGVGVGLRVGLGLGLDHHELIEAAPQSHLTLARAAYLDVVDIITETEPAQVVVQPG